MNHDNKLIDIAKFVAALIVVGIHTRPLSGISPDLDYILFNGIALLAVPFFFTISAYFLFAKINRTPENESQITHNYAKRLLILYGFWSIPLLPYTLGYRFFGMIPSIGLLPSFFYLIKECLISSSFSGSWFLNASIIGAVVSVFLARKTGQKGLTTIGIISFLLCCMTSTYFFIFKPYIGNIYNDRFILIFEAPEFTFLVSIMYFAIGRYLATTDRESLFMYKHRYMGLLFSVLLVLGEILLIKHSPTPRAINTFTTLIPATYFIAMNLISFEGELNISQNTAYFLRQSSISYTSRISCTQIYLALQISSTT